MRTSILTISVHRPHFIELIFSLFFRIHVMQYADIFQRYSLKYFHQNHKERSPLTLKFNYCVSHMKQVFKTLDKIK